MDGLGARRAAELLVPSATCRLHLRPATSNDVLTYFAWVNEPQVRASAFHSEPIPLPTHLEWFRKRLHDANTLMFVLEAQELPVGQVRFELTGNTAVIDYTIDELMRGRGWGNELVRLGVTMLNNLRPVLVQAEVKTENRPSRAVFIRLGFEERISEGGGRLFQLYSSRIAQAGSMPGCRAC